MNICVVSNQPSRRTEYFIQAGKLVGETIRFITYEELTEAIREQKQLFIKLEPPVYRETGLLAYHALCTSYITLLKEIASIPVQTVTFLNQPEAILRTLDKVEAKRYLTGLPVTPVLLEEVSCFDELETFLSTGRISSLFLKPRFGSVAGGIMAIRRHPVSGEWIVYTPLNIDAGIVRNTKRIRRWTDLSGIKDLVDTVCQCGALAEQWIPKEKVNNETYDLRVVCRVGTVEHIVVRCSKGTITNLHLNNRAHSFATLNLPEELKKDIYRISTQAVQQTGLYYGGVDVLLRKDNSQPYIIEVNGQGDHIYEDIFNENRIYKNQLTAWVKSI